MFGIIAESLFEATRVSTSLDASGNRDWRIEEARRLQGHALRRRDMQEEDQTSKDVKTPAPKSSSKGSLLSWFILLPRHELPEKMSPIE